MPGLLRIGTKNSEGGWRISLQLYRIGANFLRFKSRQRQRHIGVGGAAEPFVSVQSVPSERCIVDNGVRVVTASDIAAAASFGHPLTGRPEVRWITRDETSVRVA